MCRMVYFKNIKTLNNLTICQNALRIPEIFLRVRQALEQLDEVETSTNLKKLSHLLSMDEDLFESSFKSWDTDFWHIVMTTIQVGLYDRYLKSQAHPLVFTAPSGMTHAAKISGGLSTIKDMITDLSNKKKPSNFQNRISQYHDSLSFFVHNEKTRTYNCLAPYIQEPEELFLFIEKYQISQIVVIGPSNLVHLSQKRNMHQIPAETDWLLHEITKSKAFSDRICIIESIDLDPLLFWFWRDYNKILRQKQNFSSV